MYKNPLKKKKNVLSKYNKTKNNCLFPPPSDVFINVEHIFKKLIDDSCIGN